MSTFIEQYNKEYAFIYENDDNVAGYREAIDWFDKNLKTPSVFAQLVEYQKEAGDIISSDREAAAFAFACETLGIGA